MNPETSQPTAAPTPTSEAQPTPGSFGAGQPAGAPPATPPVSQETTTPGVGQPVAPTVPAPTEKKGLFIALAILNVLFFIPTAIAVFVLYSSYRSAAAAGDTVTATSKLKTMQLVGWIGFAIGLVCFVLYLFSMTMGTTAP